MSNPSITADKTPWYQWDTGLTVTVSGGAMDECHFANRKQGTAYVQAVINGVARVPDELLQVAAPIKAYGYVSDGAGGQTYVEQTFDVIARNIPSDYTYTKTAQKTIRDAEQARDQAVQAAKDAKASELAADDSAVEASNSAQSAGESASAAATSASNAAKSAGDAAKSASDAKAAADKAVEDASDLLKTYTDNAKTSADNAATSASSAADAASAASGSASAAEHSATDASNAKVSAQTAKAEAATSASNAATSASNAAASATAAEKSASDAAASVDAINVIAPKSVDIAPTMVGGDSIAIGRGAKASDKGNYSIVIGSNAHVHAIGTVAIGPGAVDTIDTKGQNVIIGDNAQVNGAVSGSIVFGSYSIATKDAEMSIGHPATDTGIAETTREITHVSDPTAPTSASTKQYTDDNDAKTLTEAKKYTDDNTSNALVGNVSGKLLHVEDAWPSKPLGLTIDGAYKQDGTPSPENPVPIQVIENPVLNVIGRNLLTITEYAGAYNLPVGSDLKTNVSSQMDFDSVTGVFSLKKEILPWDDGHLFATEPLPAGTYNVSFKLWSDTGSGAYSIYVISSDYIVDSVYKSRQSNVNDKFLVGRKCTIKNEKVTLNDNQRIGLVAIVNGTTDVTNKFYVETPSVSVAVQDTYAPYAGTSLPITLPDEHPYLAALPDGTHDEIVIDKDGNVTLVARVQKVDINTNNASFGHGTETDAPYISINLSNIAIANEHIICSNYTPYVWTNKSGFVYIPSIASVVFRDDRFTSKEQALELLADTVTYVNLKETRYHLGKLDIPSLPETISNVWTDAELTTNTSMTYKRDINVAFENIVQAVVASAAGE